MVYISMPFKQIYDGIKVYIPYYNVYVKDFSRYNNAVRMYKGVHDIIKYIGKYYKVDIINSYVALPNRLCGYYLKKKKEYLM